MSVAGILILANLGQNWETLGSTVYRFGVTFLLVGMFLTLIGLLMNRWNQEPEISSRAYREFLLVGPVRREDFCCISTDANPISVLKQLLATPSRHRLRVLVAQNHNLSEEFFLLVGKFPSLIGLDIQNCRLQDVPLDSFSELWRIDWILAHNTIPQQDRNGLTILLPAVTIYYDSCTLQLLDHRIEELPPKLYTCPVADG